MTLSPKTQNSKHSNFAIRPNLKLLNLRTILSLISCQIISPIRHEMDQCIEMRDLGANSFSEHSQDSPEFDLLILPTLWFCKKPEKTKLDFLLITKTLLISEDVNKTKKQKHGNHIECFST